MEPDPDADPFAFAPVDLDAVEYLMPFGLMVDSHVTPVDHQYFQNFAEPDQRIEVYAPGAGRIVHIQHFGEPVTEDRAGIVDDYRLVLAHDCRVSSTFIHVDELEPQLAAVAPPVGGYASVDVPVEAGQRLGWFTRNVDYNLVDLSYTTDGLVDADSYSAEPWKIHVPDTFAYFAPEIAARMEALSLRTEDPRGGRFTWDVDGRLAGNWFQEGTDGYGGSDPDRYWAGHLSFAYDPIDPSLVVVSIGTFEGRSAQFAVAGNGPDPVDIGPDTGPVRYELVDYDYWVGAERWDRVHFATGITARPGTRTAGTLLVEMLDDRTIRMAVLPGTTTPGLSFADADEIRRYTR